MIIYPAIDLRGGKCVRLYQGDYARATIYNTDPISMVKTFVASNANWLHIVDLDAAKNPEHNQSALITELIKIGGIQVQTGGGIRTKEQVKKLLDQGAARVVIGSLSVTNPKEITEWFRLFGPEKLALSLDVVPDENKQPMIAINAWQNITQYSLFELVKYYQVAGLCHVLCTNVTLDGTLNGPDYSLYENLLACFPFLNLQASGGIQSLSDVKHLREKGLSGAIIGRALYENKFTLSEVLAC
ncbi:1-(5-phosphoribosyl)-5-((5-phosphoribosylamino)methylideneamino)imidazole-4-carboxamide isomerase [Gammaproteobacteria bacterium]